MAELSTVETPEAPRWPTGQCSSSLCQATIIWAVTDRNERMPVDVEPGSWPDHNVVLAPGPGDTPLATVLTKANASKAFGKRLYRSHFTTCVEAGSFRRRAVRRSRAAS